MSSIIINNKEYSNVPSVTFNKVGGGTATYTEGGGGGTTIEQLNVSAAGTYTAPTGTAYNPVVVPVGSATTPTTSITATPTIYVGSDGLITSSVSASQSVTPTVGSGFISSGTSGNISVSGSKTEQMPTQGATTITPNGLSQTAVTSGKYTTGAVTVNPLVYGVLRPDAEKVQTYTYDKLLVQNEGITIPAYTTTSTTIKAGAALSTTYTTDYDNYNYYILERFVTYPVYSSTSKAKGREEYNVTSTLYELTDIPPNNFISASGKVFTNHSVAMTATGNLTRTLYWSSGSAVSVYTSASYGLVQAAVAPTLSSGVITVNSPNINIRGSSTYLSSTYWEYMTDIRAQYVIEIYRVAKVANAINGWGVTSQMQHVLDCINNNNWTLT